MGGALLVLLFAVALLLGAAAKFLKRQPGDEYTELPVRGVLKDAELLAREGLEDPERVEVLVRYAFTDADGTRREGAQSVSRALAEALPQIPLRVRYLPERPEIHRLYLPR